MNRIILIICFLSGFTLISQQADRSKIKGVITDELTGGPIPFCNFYIYQNGQITGKGGTADLDGMFVYDNLVPGEYEIAFSDASHPEIKHAVTLNAGRLTMINPVLGLNALGTVTYTVHQSLFNPDAPTDNIINAKTLKKMPVTPGDINAIAAITSPGVQQDERTGSLYIRGARDGSTQYVIDGIKMTEPGRIPNSSIAEMRVITSGIPAEFGDVTGGIVYITTKTYTGTR